jgi:catechol 2,3-dioxygenase-like lactoylglutathione lyase family enzyme
MTTPSPLPLPLPQLHHATLTVADPEASARFYQALFGPAEVAARQGPGWSRKRLLWPNGLMLGFTRHEGTQAGSRFDCTRIGLDHVGLACGSAAEVHRWARRFDDLGIEHGPVEETAYAVVVTGRDPDGQPVELYWPRSS